MADSLADLLSLLRSGPPAVRAGAASALAGLTGSPDGLALLGASEAALAALCACVGAEAPVGEPAVKALINLSAYGPSRAAVAARAPLAAALMEAARDARCGYARACVALLANVSASDAGAAAVLQRGGAREGLHLRALLPLLAAPDGPDLLGAVFANVSRLPAARALLLDAERLLLPTIAAQLDRARPLARRATAAATLRNCAFETAPAAVAFLLSPAVDVVTALAAPLARPARYAPEEAEGMPAALAGARAGAAPEPDAGVRRLLCEALALLAAGSRAARDAMRAAKTYYVVRAFHWWLEGVEGDEAGDAGAGAGGGGVMLRALAPEEEAAEEAARLAPDDEASVAAINALVQQLWRDDEVPMGAPAPLGGAVVGGRGARAPGALSGTASEDAARRADEAAAAAARARAGGGAGGGAGARGERFATRTPAEAREMARRVATGELHAGADEVD